MLLVVGRLETLAYPLEHEGVVNREHPLQDIPDPMRAGEDTGLSAVEREINGAPLERVVGAAHSEFVDVADAVAEDEENGVQATLAKRDLFVSAVQRCRR